MAMFVIGLHAGFLSDISPEASFLCISGLFRMAVPFFILITGFYFVNITDSAKLIRWIKRVALLYGVWMVIYAPFWLRPDNPISTLINLIAGYYQLWYLAGVLEAGILLYLLRNCRPTYVITLSAVLALAGLTIQLVGNLHVFSGFIDKLLNWGPIVRNGIFLCFPFFVTGYYLGKFELHKKLRINTAVCITCVSLVIIESWINYKLVGNEGLEPLFTLFIACPVLYLYVCNLPNPAISIPAKTLAMFASALYLVHVWILNVIQHFHLIESNTVTTVVTIVLSSVAAVVTMKINDRLKFLL